MGCSSVSSIRSIRPSGVCIEAYTFLSVTAYALVLYLIATGIVMPFMGMGVLGWREDKWIWLETLLPWR